MTPSLFRIGLLLTLQCNAECKHCLFECSPKKTQKMSRDLTTKTILKAKQLGAEWISLTGGEPFLDTDLLTSLVRYTNNKGIKTEVITNGFWADTPDIAKKTLKPLVDAGLDVLNLSIDDFHEEFVPFEKTRNAYCAAVELGLKIVLMVSTGRNSRITAETLPKLLGAVKIQVPGRVRIKDPNAVLFETPFTPVGRGAELEYDSHLFNRVTCTEVLRDIGVKPNGDVLPCCGPLGSQVTLGNLYKENLDSILENARTDPRFKGIQNGFDVEGCYSSKCHACVEN